MFKNVFLNRAVNGIMWKTVAKPQMAIRRMRFACQIPKTTNTHSEYETVITFPQQQWLRECTSMLRHTYFALPSWKLMAFTC